MPPSGHLCRHDPCAATLRFQSTTQQQPLQQPTTSPPTQRPGRSTQPALACATRAVRFVAELAAEHRAPLQQVTSGRPPVFRSSYVERDGAPLWAVHKSASSWRHAICDCVLSPAVSPPSRLTLIKHGRSVRECDFAVLELISMCRATRLRRSYHTP
jgi:hypothetical protein